MQRKLAAIMAADIVGYSRLMAEDESSTYAELRTVFDHLIDPTVARHGGTTFKTTGDGFLAMFPGVNAAVDAALAIQQGFDDGPFKLRIGINLGDVIEDNGDVYGDGVNVAARLEAMTEPGQIFVSGAVVMAAERNRGDLFARVGRRRAKNIPEPLEVYRVRRAGSPGRSGGRCHMSCAAARRAGLMALLPSLSFSSAPRFHLFRWQRW